MQLIIVKYLYLVVKLKPLNIFITLGSYCWVVTKREKSIVFFTGVLVFLLNDVFLNFPLWKINFQVLTYYSWRRIGFFDDYWLWVCYSDHLWWHNWCIFYIRNSSFKYIELLKPSCLWSSHEHSNDYGLFLLKNSDIFICLQSQCKIYCAIK